MWPLQLPLYLKQWCSMFFGKQTIQISHTHIIGNVDKKVLSGQITSCHIPNMACSWHHSFMPFNHVIISGHTQSKFLTKAFHISVFKSTHSSSSIHSCDPFFFCMLPQWHISAVTSHRKTNPDTCFIDFWNSKSVLIFSKGNCVVFFFILGSRSWWKSFRTGTATTRNACFY